MDYPTTVAVKKPVGGRMTLLDNEITAFVATRQKAHAWTYIQEEIGVSRDMICREMRALGFSTAAVKSKKRAVRGRGFWRSFDE